MPLFASFIVGDSAFHLHRFFPYSVAALAAALLLLSFRRIIAARRTLRTVIGFFVLVIGAASGFMYAQDRHVPARPAYETTGETLSATVKPLTEATAVGASFISQNVQVIAAEDSNRVPIDLRDVRLIGETPLSTEHQYFIRGYIPRDSVFMNPGGQRGLSGSGPSTSGNWTKIPPWRPAFGPSSTGADHG
ncbi:MAG: hypothetical protein ACM3ON_08780 [Chloroflexota bacterium]